MKETYRYAYIYKYVNTLIIHINMHTCYLYVWTKFGWNKQKLYL